MKTLLFTLIIIIESTVVSASWLSISGPSEVCPRQEYTYTLDSDFFFGSCGTYIWAIYDSNGNQVEYGAGPNIKFTFPAPANKTYKIQASISGGIGCYNTETRTLNVLTKYPKPSIGGVSVLCPGGQSKVYTPTVSATLDCFHWEIDWKIPQGLSVSYGSNGKVTLSAPNSASGKYTVSARCKILPSNEYGDWTHKSVWVGSPEFGTNSIQGDDEVNVGNFEYYTAPSATNNPSYNWTYTYPGSSCSWKILNNNSKKLYAQAECDGQGWLTVTASNACGSVSLDKYVEILGGSGGGGGNPCGTAPMMVKAFPNPSPDGFFSFKIDQLPDDPCDGGGGPEMPASIEQPDEEIKIYDFNGALIFSRKISSDDGMIENVNLKTGNYILKTGNDAESAKQELLIVE